MDFIILAIGIATAGYFIGKGLENFQQPSAENTIDSFFQEDENQLIEEKNIHYLIGISKKDSQALLKEYPEIPHIQLNGRVYYHKKQIKEWLEIVSKK